MVEILEHFNCNAMMNYMEHLVVVIFLELGLLVLPMIFIGLDFWAGIRKAHQRAERITSDGWQRSVRKLSRYYNFIFAFMMLDVLQLVGLCYLNAYWAWNAVLYPWFTNIGVLIVAAIEIKSIMEPADAKEKKQMREVQQLAAAILAHRDDVKGAVEELTTYLRSTEINRNGGDL